MLLTAVTTTLMMLYIGQGYLRRRQVGQSMASVVFSNSIAAESVNDTHVFR